MQTIAFVYLLFLVAVFIILLIFYAGWNFYNIKQKN